MEKTYIASAEIIYLGYERIEAKESNEAMEKASEMMDKLDVPHFVGKSHRFYLNDIRIDNVEYNHDTEYLGNFNLQYLGSFEITADSPDEASEIAEEILRNSGIRDEFGNFELESQYVYDLAQKLD